MHCAGLRISEAVAINVEDFDLGDRTLFFELSKTDQANHGATLRLTKVAVTTMDLCLNVGGVDTDPVFLPIVEDRRTQQTS